VGLFFVLFLEKHILFKLKENLPFCLRVSADIWNSQKKRCSESVKTNLYFLQSSEGKNISAPETFSLKCLAGTPEGT